MRGINFAGLAAGRVSHAPPRAAAEDPAPPGPSAWR